MAPPKDIWYGSFDGIPSRYAMNEAWIFRGGDVGWDEINSVSHGSAVSELTKEDFEHLFPGLPPLPPEAFKEDRE